MSILINSTMGIGYIGTIATSGSGIMSLKNSSSFMGQVDNVISSKTGFSVLDLIQNQEPEIKIKDVELQSSTYGRTIPEVFGRFIIAGNIIYSSSIQIIKKTSSVNTKLGSQKTVENEAIVTFAVAVCVGKVNKVHGIYADGNLIDINNSAIKIYYGTEEQQVNSSLSERIGYGKTPAFKGICYVVFNNFNITDYGNRIPNLTFDIERNLINESSVNTLVQSINIIPGSGEFVYETSIKEKYYVGYFDNKQIERTKRIKINSNNLDKKADALVALDNLFIDLPNIKHCSVVCSWFSNSDNASITDIYPACEFNDYIVSGNDWTVNGVSRTNAKLVTKDSNGYPNYGGTPSDESLLSFFKELKNRGLKTTLYPMIFIDNQAKTWRGYFKYTDIQSLKNNFFPKYKKFILYYANLLKDRIDAFIIGSEFVSLTKIKDENNNFIFVDFLIELSNEVRNIVGNNVKITYAANWDEYHHTDGGWYNLDKLWASKNIDIIGIDAYFPLTNTSYSLYDIDKIKAGWTSGEGYDFYYGTYKNNPNPISEAYAWKNIQYFWENHHYNPDGKKTEWTPKMKKIWFTEYGFPSVSCCTNEPNAFFKSLSNNDNFPYLSNGNIDFKAQRAAIEATELKWKNSEMIEKMFLWCYDARPYPFFPQLTDVWSDYESWQYGHWVQGKIKTTSLTEFIKLLCVKSGIAESDIQIININETLNGYYISDSSRIIDILIDLSRIFDFEIYQSYDKVVFKSYKNPTVFSLDNNDIIINENGLAIQVEKNINFSLSNKAQIFFNNYNDLYRIDNMSISFFNFGNDKIDTKIIKTGVSMNESEANSTLRSLMNNRFTDKDIFSFSIPYSKYSDISVLDIISISFSDGIVRNLRIFYIEITYDQIMNIKAYQDDRFNERYSIDQNNYIPLFDKNNLTKITNLDSYIFECKNFDKNLNKLNFYYALEYKNEDYEGFTDIYCSFDNEESYELIETINGESDIGQIISELPSNINHFFTDFSTKIDIFFQDISLSKLKNFDVKELKNSEVNRIIIGSYLINFCTFEIIESENLKFARISNLLFQKININYNSSNSDDKVFLLNNMLYSFSLDRSFANSTIFLKAVPKNIEIDFVDSIKIKITGNSILADNNVQCRLTKDLNAITLSLRPKPALFTGNFGNLSKDYYYYLSINKKEYYLDNKYEFSSVSNEKINDIEIKTNSVLRI